MGTNGVDTVIFYLIGLAILLTGIVIEVESLCKKFMKWADRKLSGG